MNKKLTPEEAAFFANNPLPSPIMRDGVLRELVLSPMEERWFRKGDRLGQPKAKPLPARVQRVPDEDDPSESFSDLERHWLGLNDIH